MLVSVSGGRRVVTGGAPLDLVLSKVENIKALFLRTVEYLQHLPHRKHGAAPPEVQNVCRPWLFQAAPGSYQFAVAIEDVAQRNLFGPEIPSIDQIKDTFLSFLRASANDPEVALAERLPEWRLSRDDPKADKGTCTDGQRLFGSHDQAQFARLRPDHAYGRLAETNECGDQAAIHEAAIDWRNARRA